MSINFSFQVWHAGVTELYSIFVKYFVKFAVRSKMFDEESKEVFIDARLQRHAVGWVKSYNIKFAVFESVFIFFSLLLIS